MVSVWPGAIGGGWCGSRGSRRRSAARRRGRRSRWPRWRPGSRRPFLAAADRRGHAELVDELDVERHVGRHVGGERVVALDRNLGVERLAVELGGAEHVEAPLFAREALDEADLLHVARRDVEDRRVVDVEAADRRAGAAGDRRGRVGRLGASSPGAAGCPSSSGRRRSGSGRRCPSWRSPRRDVDAELGLLLARSRISDSTGPSAHEARNCPWSASPTGSAS